VPALLIFIALILIVSAWRNTQTTLATALATDVAGFGKWFAAMACIGALQWVPGMKVPARMLLALVIVVLVLLRYQQILAGFSDLTTGTTATAQTDPATAYVAAPNTGTTTGAAGLAEASGTSAGTTTPGNVSATQSALVTAPNGTGLGGAFSPQALVNEFSTAAPGMLFSAAVMGSA
jgi:hypothetical protein